MLNECIKFRKEKCLISSQEADLILANKSLICSISNDSMDRKILKSIERLTLTSNSFGSGSKIYTNYSNSSYAITVCLLNAQNLLKF